MTTRIFIGLMHFCSILLPSALLTWLPLSQVGPAALGDRYDNLTSAEAASSGGMISVKEKVWMEMKAKNVEHSPVVYRLILGLSLERVAAVRST